MILTITGVFIMERERIDEIVCDIMRADGPDRHTDGHEVLTDFIVALLRGNGEEWRASYRSKREIMDADPEFLELQEMYQCTI